MPAIRLPAFAVWRQYGGFKKYIAQAIDWITVTLTLGLAVFGVICIARLRTSAGYEEGQSAMAYIGSLFSGNALRQLIFLGISIALAVAVLFVDYQNIRQFVTYIFWGAAAVLAAVLVFGSRQRGMTGWFYFSALGVGIQPGELCKIAAILVYAREFAKVTEGRTMGISHWKELWPVVWKCGVLAGLVVLQPDFGTAMVYVVIAAALLFMAKTSWKILGPLLGGRAGLSAAHMAGADAGTEKPRICLFGPDARSGGRGL